MKGADTVQCVFSPIPMALEVHGTMLLPFSQNFTRLVPTLSLIGCYAASFVMPDPRPEYAADIGGLLHSARSKQFSDNPILTPGV